MTEEVTATIGSVEVNADDLEAAIEEFSDDNDNIDPRDGGYGVRGNAALKGGNYSDHYCHVANVEDVNSLTEERMDVDDDSDIQRTNLRRLRGAIEEARGNVVTEEEKVEHVANIVASPNTVVASSSEDADNDYGDVEIQYGHLTDNEMSDLEADEAVSFSKVAARGGTAYVSVDVDEDVLADE